MLFRFLLLVGLYLSSSPFSFAQVHFRKLPFDWQGHVGVGYFSAPALRSMTDASQLRGVPQFGGNLALGLGFPLGKAILGMNVASNYAFRGDDQLRNTTLSAYVSTNMWHLGKWTISPTLGIGPQFTTASIDVGEVSGNFEDYLTRRANQTRLSHTVAAVDVGLTFKTYDLLTASYRSKFRIGYQTGLHQSAWQVGRTELADAPRDRTGTLYLQISTGIGY